MIRYRRRTLHNAVSADTSLLHTGARVDFFALAGMPKDGEPVSIEFHNTDVKVRWAVRPCGGVR